jgi:UDP-N-acetylmuramyl pentapeptide synthase
MLTATVSEQPQGPRLALATPAGEITVQLAVAGAHNVHNALAAAAAALAIGVPNKAIAAGLGAFRAVNGRGVRLATPGGAVLVDDSYNANPDSVRAAIDLLATLPAPRVLVLGDMGEVGDQGPEFHREIGAHARAAGIERLIATGPLMSEAVAAFGAGAEHHAEFETLLAAVRAAEAGAGALLVKGSRFMRMERVVQALAAAAGGEGAHAA